MSSLFSCILFRENSVKLLLDADTAVGERNKRYADKLLAFRQGLIDFEKSLDALTTAPPKTGGTLRGAGGTQEMEDLSFQDLTRRKRSDNLDSGIESVTRGSRNCRIKGLFTPLEQASSTNSEITHC